MPRMNGRRRPPCATSNPALLSESELLSEGLVLPVGGTAGDPSSCEPPRGAIIPKLHHGALEKRLLLAPRKDWVVS